MDGHILCSLLVVSRLRDLRPDRAVRRLLEARLARLDHPLASLRAEEFGVLARRGLDPCIFGEASRFSAKVVVNRLFHSVVAQAPAAPCDGHVGVCVRVDVLALHPCHLC